MRKLKEIKGITLIALVITIIVLLILAGVGISALTGQDGIITKSIEAKENDRGAAVEEIKNLWKTNESANKYANGESQTLEELLGNLVSQGKLTETEKTEILAENNANHSIKIGNKVIVFGENNEDEELAAGLYETGTNNLLYTWQGLIENNLITVNGTDLSYIASSYNGKRLKGNLIIDEGITKCSYRSGCGSSTEITGITIPSTMKEINSYTFFVWFELENVKIKNGLEKINSDAFRDCKNLKNINIPDTVNTIGERAFYGCSSLMSIYLPKSVTTIGNSAFYSGGGGIIIYCEANEKQNGWDNGWNSGYPNAYEVKYGYTREQYEKEINNQ